MDYLEAVETGRGTSGAGTSAGQTGLDCSEARRGPSRDSARVFLVKTAVIVNNNIPDVIHPVPGIGANPD